MLLLDILHRHTDKWENSVSSNEQMTKNDEVIFFLILRLFILSMSQLYSHQLDKTSIVTQTINLDY